MTMNQFSYANASTVDEAVEVLSEDCRPLAGGTDLLAMMKEGLAAPERLVNLKTIPGLDRVEQRGDGLRIGALTTLARLAAHPLLGERRELNVLREAILGTASPQLRHMATMGGNLLQQPRCWYFRNRLTHCWLRGGQHCFAVRGENKHHAILGRGACQAVHASDPAVALVALDATVTLVGPDGERAIAPADAFRQPQRDWRIQMALRQDELVVAVSVAAPASGSWGTYLKVADRSSWDFALVSVAVQLVVSEGIVQRARIVLGGVGPRPWRATAAEKALADQPLAHDVIEQVVAAATEGARPLADNVYKVDLTQGLVREALSRQAGWRCALC